MPVKKAVFQPSGRDKWQQFDDYEIEGILQRKTKAISSYNVGIVGIPRNTMIKMIEELSHAGTDTNSTSGRM